MEPANINNTALHALGIRAEWQASGRLLSLQISSVTPGFFSGHVPGQELKGSGGCEGMADLFSKLRKNSGCVRFCCKELARLSFPVLSGWCPPVLSV